MKQFFFLWLADLKEYHLLTVVIKLAILSSDYAFLQVFNKFNFIYLQRAILLKMFPAVNNLVVMLE